MKQVLVFEDKQGLAKFVMEQLAGLSRHLDELSIALSGGSTPKAIFDYIADKSAEHLIDWNKIKLFWGDERCVPPQDAESNFRMTFDHLISKIDIPEENIFRIKGENDPEKEAERYSGVIKKELPILEGVPEFDVIMLGMGDDGHTASIFPHEIGLFNSNSDCIVAKHPNSGQARISITGRVINNARQVWFLVTGGNKAEKLKEILTETEVSKNYPAAMVNPDSENLLWLVDISAFQLLAK